MSVQPTPSPDQQERLRALFKEASRPVYERALAHTQSPTRAREILALVLRDAARTPLLCLEREGYLLELCESFCEREKAPAPLRLREEPIPAPAIEAPAARQEAPAVRWEDETPAEPWENEALPRKESVPPPRAAAPRRYNLDEDEWLQELRASRRRSAQTPASSLRVVEPAPRQKPLPPAPPKAPAEPLLEEFEEPPRAGFFARLSIFVSCLMIAALLWTIAGLLMSLDVLPDIDLGYDWFNANIWRVF